MTRIIEGKKNQIYSFVYRNYISLFKPKDEVEKPKAKKRKRVFLINSKNQCCEK